MAREVRGWFTNPAPEIGYQVSEQWYGWLGGFRGALTRVILTLDVPERVPAALAAIRDACGEAVPALWVDDRDRAARLGPALRAGGATPGDATTHLALAGSLTTRPGPAGLTMARAGDDAIAEWARVKVMCFAGSEAAPAAGAVAAEVAARRQEMPLAACWTAWLDGRPAGVLACYTGPDQLVFNLGTRVPCRHRGVAQAMLAHWVAAGQAAGCRSLMINATDGGQPAALYRRIGFTDEVYWYQKYAFGRGQA